MGLHGLVLVGCIGSMWAYRLFLRVGRGPRVHLLVVHVAAGARVCLSVSSPVHSATSLSALTYASRAHSPPSRNKKSEQRWAKAKSSCTA